MLRCTRAEQEESNTNAVNILHVSVDLDLATTELNRMVAFMEGAGFAVKLERGLCDWPSADVLILGTDKRRLANLGRVLDVLVSRIGLVQGWDVLLYGTSGKVTTKSQPPERPLCSNLSFGLLGTCMLHGHIRLHDDVRFWQGFFAHMLIEIETWLDRILGRTNTTLHSKLRNMKCKIENTGLDGQDARLFLAASHLVRNSRNIFVHSQRNVPAEEMKKRTVKADGFMQEFCAVAISCGRADLLPCPNTHNESRHELIKYLTRIALYARRWAHDCHAITP